MSDYIEFKGRTLDEAIAEACAFYSAEREKLEIDIISDAKSGIFGLVGAKKATIRARRAQLDTKGLAQRAEKPAHEKKAHDKKPEKHTPEKHAPEKPGRMKEAALPKEAALKDEMGEAAAREERKPAGPAASEAQPQTEHAGREHKEAHADTRKHPREARQHTGEARQHSGEARQSSGEARQNYGETRQGAAEPRHREDAPDGRPQRKDARPDSRHEGRGEDKNARPLRERSKPHNKNRPDRMDRPERPERTDRPERPERPERAERAERQERPDRHDRPERREKPARMPRERHNNHAPEAFEGADFEESPAFREVALESLDQELLRSTVLEAVKNLAAPIVGEEATCEMALNDDRIQVTINNVENPGLLIGRDGQTLSSLQYLVACIASRRMQASLRVQIDAGDYRERQNDKLREMALELAQKVVEGGKPLSTRPLSAYQRRMVHLALQDHPDVQSHSKGDGAMKRVVLVPKRKTAQPA